MDIVKIILRLVHLLSIAFRIVTGSTTHWLEDVTGADLSYSPSLLTTSASSLVICLVRCSVGYKTATYNNGTEVCECFNTTTSTASQVGNRRWNLTIGHSDGFSYIVKLDFHVRLFTDRKKTNPDAQQFCSTLGARLVVLDTMEKFNFVVGLDGFPDDTYIHVGAKEQTEGVFVWNTGARITSNWIPGEPNNAQPFGEECVGAKKIGFNDIRCQDRTYFVCERD